MDLNNGIVFESHRKSVPREAGSRGYIYMYMKGLFLKRPYCFCDYSEQNGTVSKQLHTNRKYISNKIAL